MMDKFLTDLAQFAGSDSVTVSYHGYWSDESRRFEVRLWNFSALGLDQGTGPTVEAAMNAAIAAKRAREAEAE